MWPSSRPFDAGRQVSGSVIPAWAADIHKELCDMDETKKRILESPRYVPLEDQWRLCTCTVL